LNAATPCGSFSSLGSYIREYWQLLVTATSILEADEKDGRAVSAGLESRIARQISLSLKERLLWPKKKRIEKWQQN
jgi:hypothetical protein